MKNILAILILIVLYSCNTDKKVENTVEDKTDSIKSNNYRKYLDTSNYSIDCFNSTFNKILLKYNHEDFMSSPRGSKPIKHDTLDTTFYCSSIAEIRNNPYYSEYEFTPNTLKICNNRNTIKLTSMYTMDDYLLLYNQFRCISFISLDSCKPSFIISHDKDIKMHANETFDSLPLETLFIIDNYLKTTCIIQWNEKITTVRKLLKDKSDYEQLRSCYHSFSSPITSLNRSQLYETCFSDIAPCDSIASFTHSNFYFCNYLWKGDIPGFVAWKPKPAK